MDGLTFRPAWKGRHPCEPPLSRLGARFRLQSIAQRRTARAPQAPRRAEPPPADRRNQTSRRRKIEQTSAKQGSSAPCYRRESVQVGNRPEIGQQRKCQTLPEAVSKSTRIE